MRWFCQQILLSSGVVAVIVVDIVVVDINVVAVIVVVDINVVVDIVVVVNGKNNFFFKNKQINFNIKNVWKNKKTYNNC